ncbi:MAG: hypothetical protein R6U68_11300 [Desulfobacteraceae bacterium]
MLQNMVLDNYCHVGDKKTAVLILMAVKVFYHEDHEGHEEDFLLWYKIVKINT